MVEKTGPGLHADAVAELFAETFEREAVGLDEDFFRLGGDSLLGAVLMSAIEKRFGLVLSISMLLETPTPRALADAIFEKNASRIVPCLISINPDGTLPTIFCVHGNVGESVAPLRLSAAIGGRAFFAFRAIGLEQGELPLTTTEAIATSYLTGITEVRPRGPRVLLGHCAGAILAYEMAQQFAAVGQPIAGLIMLDPEASDEFAPYLHRTGLDLVRTEVLWQTRAAEIDAVLEADPNPTGNLRRKLVANGIKLAVATYRPRPYAGPTLLISTRDRTEALLNPDRGYPSLVRDLEVVELDIRHGKMFKDGLPEVARAIDQFVAGL